ncbi:hypothetical protein ZBT109_2571 [Zymobacter palmae]|uniref:Uncharacterized protein n=1 Tax=Zymobacter palmae TaxID=33074 RepID=A0A348HI49_9GAMM|nr:hypothetical protein ZBT109_2571 [Zymobacter palmae]
MYQWSATVTVMYSAPQPDPSQTTHLADEWGLLRLQLVALLLCQYGVIVRDAVARLQMIQPCLI